MRDCLAELCPYWPGEGCLRGVAPCDELPGGRCKHELPAGSRTDCMPKPQRAEFAQPAQLGPWITASYGGHCSSCGDYFPADDQIRADGQGGWLCWDCGGQ